MIRPRRSALYMPGANERALEKAKTLPADVLIFDLEDAVAPDAKAEARRRVCAAAASGAYTPREVVIRINGLATPWFGDDLRAAAEAGPTGVLVPKIESPDDVLRVEAALEKAGAGDYVEVWAMVESPTAVLRVPQIAAAGDRLTVLVVGTNDLAYELRAEHVPGRGPLLNALSQILLAGRSAGRTVLDGVYNDVRDPVGFEAECRQGRQWGFDGKTLIHPDQVGPCNQVFSPSASELDRARRVVRAFAEAEADGRGVVTVDGRMVENLHVAEARRILALDAAIAASAVTH